MKKLIGLFVALLMVSACTDDDRTLRVLREQGYTDIKVTGYAAFMCSDSDTFSTGFTAKTASGAPVRGAVCSGWLKGATVRLK